MFPEGLKKETLPHNQNVFLDMTLNFFSPSKCSVKHGFLSETSPKIQISKIRKKGRIPRKMTMVSRLTIRRLQGKHCKNPHPCWDLVWLTSGTRRGKALQENLRWWYFSGPYYQARLSAAIEEAYRNVCQPLAPPRRTRSGLYLDPRMQNALNKIRGLKRVLHPEEDWLNGADPPRVLDSLDLTSEQPQPQPERAPDFSLVTYLSDLGRYKSVHNGASQTLFILGKKFVIKTEPAEALFVDEVQKKVLIGPSQTLDNSSSSSEEESDDGIGTTAEHESDAESGLDDKIENNII